MTAAARRRQRLWHTGHLPHVVGVRLQRSLPATPAMMVGLPSVRCCGGRCWWRRFSANCYGARITDLGSSRPSGSFCGSLPVAGGCWLRIMCDLPPTPSTDHTWCGNHITLSARARWSASFRCAAAWQLPLHRVRMSVGRSPIGYLSLGWYRIKVSRCPAVTNVSQRNPAIINAVNKASWSWSISPCLLLDGLFRVM